MGSKSRFQASLMAKKHPKVSHKLQINDLNLTSQFIEHNEISEIIIKEILKIYFPVNLNSGNDDAKDNDYRNDYEFWEEKESEYRNESFGMDIGLTRLVPPFFMDPLKEQEIRSLEQQMQTKSIDLSHACLLGQIYAQQKNSSKFMRVHRYIIKKYPKSPELLYLRGLKALLIDRNFEDSLKILKQAREKGIETEYIDLYLGNTYMNLSQIDQAKHYYLSAAKKNSNFAEAWHNMAVVAYNQEHNLQKAEEYFLHSIYAEPMYFNGWWSLYMFLKQNLDEMPEWYKKMEFADLITYILLFAPYHPHLDKILPDCNLTYAELKYIFTIPDEKRAILKLIYVSLWEKFHRDSPKFETFFEKRKIFYDMFVLSAELFIKHFKHLIMV